MNSRHFILQQLEKQRKATKDFEWLPVDGEATIYTENQLPPEERFKHELEKIKGHCVVCTDSNHLVAQLNRLYAQKQWQVVFCNSPELQKTLQQTDIQYTDQEADFENQQAAIVGAEFLVAQFGAVMTSSRLSSGRRQIAYAPELVVIASTSQLLHSIDEALDKLQQKYAGGLPSAINLISGPSRTADIEKTLILGAHGPKELYVFLLKHEKQP